MKAVDATVEEQTDRHVSVLVVDDHRTFADAMRIAVDIQPDMQCEHAAPSAEAALEVVERDGCPDVILLDVRLPGMDGVSAVRALVDRCPDARIVLLTADTSARTIVDAVEAGAHGYLPKSYPFTKVLELIRRLDDQIIAEPLSLERALGHATEANREVDRPLPIDLTSREYEVLVLLAEGLPVKQIASRLHLSVNTCRGHVAALLRKFDAHSQLAAVVAAAGLGLLPNLSASRTDQH